MLTERYSYCNTSEYFQNTSLNGGEFSSVIQKARQEALHMRTHFHDSPSRVSGWLHNFACPDCATTLKFDPDMTYTTNNVYVCPHCGKTVSGRKFDEAWVYQYRFRYSYQLDACILSALSGDVEARDFIMSEIDFYAEHYSEFEPHGEAVGKGKIMAQSLDEAFMGVYLLRALQPFRAYISKERMDFWYKKLFNPMCELIYPQAGSIHNIPTWLMCFVGMAGIFFNNDEWLDKALNSTYGIRNQFSKGFTADKLWRECSLGYHYYTLMALMSFYSFYMEAHPDDVPYELLEKAFVSPVLMSRDGWTLTALNDGWYPLHTSFPIIYAARFLRSKALYRQVHTLLEHEPDIRNTAYYALYYDPDMDSVTEPEEISKQPVLFADTNLGLFRKPVFAILKSGVIEASHMHLDPLSVILPPFADDIGTPGYGHILTHTWYRKGIAHCCVNVDCATPKNVIKTHVSMNDGRMKAEVEPGEWPDVVKAERSLYVKSDMLMDETHFECAGVHTIDWVFHSDGECFVDAPGTPAEALGSENGYEHLSEIRRLHPSGDLNIRFVLNGKALHLKVSNSAAYQCYLCLSPGNPADKKRTTLILRSRSEHADFTVSYRETEA